MRRKCFIIAAVALMLAVVSGTVLAQSAELSTTRQFLDRLDSEGIGFQYVGTNGGMERVDIDLSWTDFDSARCVVFFGSDLGTVSLRIWDIVRVTAGVNYTLSALNALNRGHRFAKFVYDETDATVQVEADICVDPDHCGACVYEMMQRLSATLGEDDVRSRLLSLK